MPSIADSVRRSSSRSRDFRDELLTLLRRPSCELMFRIRLVADDCRNSGSSASVSIFAP
uniref:Uncharacterized protein n=1 Tax=Arundo donax TaxID=35708 RepID=A0A0A9FXA5_ARUDO